MPWIDRLFEVMAGRYGARFADAWRGVKPELVKREWARGLGKLTQEQVARGVELLDQCTFPPTLSEFVKLCQQSVPESHRLRLSAPRPTPEQREKGRQALAAMLARQKVAERRYVIAG